MLTQLLYISRHVGSGIENPTNFMSEARERNKNLGISSILLSADIYYIHLIEGNRSNVNELYNRITRDARHEMCTLLRYTEVKSREFAVWNAEHVNMKDFNVDGMNLLSPSSINFEKITSAQAVTMIRRIHAHLIVRSEKSPRILLDR